MYSKFMLPTMMPKQKILAVDVGGTLAKACFYVPREYQEQLDQSKYDMLTEKTIPSK